jgi:hypothetical protein
LNILHVLSGDFVSGSETSTAALAAEQMKHGHKVFIVAGGFSQPTQAKFIRVPIFDRGPLRRLMNIGAIWRIIIAEGIDLVHAHSRAASWVCYWACGLTGTAYLSTLHGRQHLHFTNRHFNIYGPWCIAVCENIREQMLQETSAFKLGQLAVIRNGIHLKTNHGRK